MGSATLSTMIYAGQTMSLGIMLFIFSIFLGNVQIIPSNFQLFLISLKTAFIVFAAVSGVGFDCINIKLEKIELDNKKNNTEI